MVIYSSQQTSCFDDAPGISMENGSANQHNNTYRKLLYSRNVKVGGFSFASSQMCNFAK